MRRPPSNLQTLTTILNLKERPRPTALELLTGLSIIADMDGVEENLKPQKSVAEYEADIADFCRDAHFDNLITYIGA